MPTIELAIEQVQTDLLIPKERRSPRIGPVTRAQFEKLASLPLGAELTPPPLPQPVIPNAPYHPGPAAVRNIPSEARKMIESFEGLQLKAYRDEVGIWTIGYGHTGKQHNDGTVYPGRVITAEKADQLLDYDMDQFESRVCSLVRIPITDFEFGALVAFDFNTGGLTLDGGEPSTLLKLMNVGDRPGVAGQFPLWNHAGGVVLGGLTRRRKAERALFLGNLPEMWEWINA